MKFVKFWALNLKIKCPHFLLPYTDSQNDRVIESQSHKLTDRNFCRNSFWILWPQNLVNPSNTEIRKLSRVQCSLLVKVEENTKQCSYKHLYKIAWAITLFLTVNQQSTTFTVHTINIHNWDIGLWTFSINKHEISIEKID